MFEVLQTEPDGEQDTAGADVVNFITLNHVSVGAGDKDVGVKEIAALQNEVGLPLGPIGKRCIKEKAVLLVLKVTVVRMVALDVHHQAVRQE